MWGSILFLGVHKNNKILCPHNLPVYYKTGVCTTNQCIMNNMSELITKNNQHRSKDINMKNKCTRAYALPGNERYLVKRLDTYISLLPPSAPYFYMRVLEKFPAELMKSCVTKQRVGVNVLKTFSQSKLSGYEHIPHLYSGGSWRQKSWRSVNGSRFSTILQHILLHKYFG